VLAVFRWRTRTRAQ